jgi:hypothetical protein
MAMTPEQRKARIIELMEKFDMSRAQAEIAVAFETGEITGDAFIYDDDRPLPGPDERPGRKSRRS